MMKQSMNSSFSSKRFKNGAYSSVITVIVLVVILVANLLVSQLDLKIDISEAGYFTLSDTTKNYLDSLTDDIHIYYLMTESGEDTMVKDMVDKYDSASSHVSVEVKDFELYPNFVYSYVDQDTRVYQNSVIVENAANGRSRYISYLDMVLYSYDSNYNRTLNGYDVEGQITSAIQYVTSEDIPKIYTTTGHGEISLGTYATEYLEKQNIEVESLETLTMEAVPEDCQALVIVGANKDFTESETEKIGEYLENGGRAVIYVDYVEGSMTNFEKLLATYGVALEDGIVLETQSSHMINNTPYMIAPDVQEHDVTASCTDGGKYVGTYMPVGLIIDCDIRGSVKREALLMTSDGAFSKVNMQSGTFSKEDGDIDGPLCLGVAVTEDYNDVTTKLIVYSGSNILHDTFMGVSSLGNAELFTDTLNWVVERQESVVSIPTKSFSQQYLTLTSAEANRLSIILVLILPAAILICGGVVWYKRRRK